MLVFTGTCFGDGEDGSGNNGKIESANAPAEEEQKQEPQAIHPVTVDGGTEINPWHFSASIYDASKEYIVIHTSAPVVSVGSTNSAAYPILDGNTIKLRLLHSTGGGSLINITYSDGVTEAIAIDYSAVIDTKTHHNISLSSSAGNFTKRSIDSYKIKLNDLANDTIAVKTDYPIKSAKSLNGERVTVNDPYTITIDKFVGRMATCSLRITWEDGITDSMDIAYTAPGIEEELGIDDQVIVGDVPPLQFASVRSKGSLSHGADNEWLLVTHSVAQEPIFVDTTKPVKNIKMASGPQVQYIILSPTRIMVYLDHDRDLGAVLAINYEDGTSDKLYVRIKTDLTLAEDIQSYQATLFDAFLNAKKDDGFEICYTGEHLQAYQNIISANKRTFKNPVEIKDGVVVLPKTLNEFFFSYDIANGKFDLNTKFFAFKSNGNFQAFAYYSQQSNHWCIDRNDTSVPCLVFATQIGSSKVIDVVQVVFGEGNLSCVDANLNNGPADDSKMHGGEEVILKEPEHVEISEEIIEKVSEEKSIEIEVTKDVHISFDAKASEFVTSTAKEESLDLIVSQKKSDELSSAQAQAIQDKEVKTIVSVEMGGKESIHSFSGGKATVSFPFSIPASDNPAYYRVYYIADSGDLFLMPSEYKDGIMTFTTSHFSDYAVIKSEEPIAEPEAEVEPQSESTTQFNILLLLIPLAVIIVVISIIIIKKKRH